MPTLCPTKSSLSPTPSQPHTAHPGCRLGFGAPVSPLAPVPDTLGVFAHPWGMPLGHAGPREEGSVGQGGGGLLPTPGASPGEQGGPGGGPAAGSPPHQLPFHRSRSCWAAQRRVRGWSRPGWRPDRASPAGALGQGEDGTSRGDDEVALERRAPGAQPTGARSQGSLCRGHSPRPACAPSLRGCPCHTCCCPCPSSAMATSAASPGRGWALPPLARRLGAPLEAARLSGLREPAPGPWGRPPRGREAPPGPRKGGFLCSCPV